MPGNLMECNVWIVPANDSHFGLFYCNITGNIYPPITSSFNLQTPDRQPWSLSCRCLQSSPCSSWFMICLCLLLILSSQLLISTSCSTLPPSSLNHLQSSCPKNRACFRFRPQLSWRRKTLKLSTMNPLSFSSSTRAPWSCITWGSKKARSKKIWASAKTQISVNVLKMFFSLSFGSWRKLFSGFASLSRI